MVMREPWSCPRCGVAWRDHPNQHTENELCMRCDAIAVREGFCTAHYELAAADGIPRKQKMHACCYRPIGESHADYCTVGVKEGWEGFGKTVTPQATINAPPLAPICYICGCAQTEEHAALPHNDYGVAWDRVPVRKVPITKDGIRSCCNSHISTIHADSCSFRHREAESDG